MRYTAETQEINLIHRYTGIPFPEILKLDICDYLQLRRDAAIDMYSQTDKGREYLENCWRISQTEPDREALRTKFGGES